MFTVCNICGISYDKKYTGWETRYVPDVCGGACCTRYLRRKKTSNIDTDIIVKAQEYENSMGFRSSYEKNFANWAWFTAKLIYKYERSVFTFNNGSQYIPDFYIIQSGIFIEVKGVWEPGARQKFLKFVDSGLPICLINKWFLNLIIRRKGSLG